MIRTLRYRDDSGRLVMAGHTVHRGDLVRYSLNVPLSRDGSVPRATSSAAGSTMTDDTEQERNVHLGRRIFCNSCRRRLATGDGRAGTAAEEPLRVGSILSVTGPAAFLGEDMKAGLQLAVDEINAAGGINGRQIAWTFYDAESQTQKAITATRRLISQDNVELILSGGNMSGIALAMAPLAEAAKMPFISSEGALAIVTPVAERHWVFKSTVDDDDVLERIADYLDKKKIKKVALLADTSGFGQGAVAQMHKVGPRGNSKSCTSPSAPPTPT